MKHFNLKATLKLVSLLLIAITSTHISFAQSPYDSTSINYSYYPSKEFKGMAGKASVNYFDINILTPAIKLGKQTSIKNAFSYKSFKYDFEELESSWGNLPSQLHDLRYTLFLRHQFNSKWGFFASPRLNIRGDLKDGLKSDAFTPAITALVIHTSSKKTNLQWGVGLSYSSDLNPNSFVPIVSFDYLSTKMRVNLFLPISGQIVFTPSKRFEYGFLYNNESSLYHISTGNINNNEAKYLKSLNALFSLTSSYNLTKNIWLNAKAGYVLNMNYDILNNDYEVKNNVMKNNFKPAPFLSAGVSIRVKGNYHKQ